MVTPISTAQIETRLQALLAPLHLEIEDDGARHAGHAGAASGGHFNVTIVTPAFAGKSRVARHRLVYDALADAMRDGIHALAIAAYTPEEFNNLPR
jgi:BolA family transcriptional regulator, general stress-responsive regulator